MTSEQILLIITERRKKAFAHMKESHDSGNDTERLSYLRGRFEAFDGLLEEIRRSIW